MKLLSHPLFFLLLLGILPACTVYQSGQREAIEKDSGNIVTKEGFTEGFTNFYECTGTYQRPSFLDHANEVLVTPFEMTGYTVLTPQIQPLKWITVFRFLEETKSYYYCKVQSGDGHKYSLNELYQSAHVGVTEIESLMLKSGQ